MLPLEKLETGFSLLGVGLILEIDSLELLLFNTNVLLTFGLHSCLLEFHCSVYKLNHST